MDDNQKKARQGGLGGTDIVAIIGESPYKSAIDVYQDKIGEAEDWDGNERTEWGLALEPVIADRYARDSGHRLLEMPTLMRTDRPWHRGTPDRLAYDMGIDRGEITGVEPVDPTDLARVAISDPEYFFLRKPERGLEIKSHGHYGGKGYGEDEIPDDKRIQSAWYQALLHVEEWDVVALIDTHLYRGPYRVRRDQQLEDYLLEEAELFWTKHVLARVPPPPDGSEAFSRYIKQRFTKHDAELVEADDHMVDMLEEIKQLDAKRKDADKRRELLCQLVQSQVGPHLGAKHNGKPVVTWRQDARGRVRSSEVYKWCREEFGMTDDEWDEMLDRHRGEPGRRFLVK